MFLMSLPLLFFFSLSGSRQMPPRAQAKLKRNKSLAFHAGIVLRHTWERFQREIYKNHLFYVFERIVSSLNNSFLRISRWSSVGPFLARLPIPEINTSPNYVIIESSLCVFLHSASNCRNSSFLLGLWNLVCGMLCAARKIISRWLADSLAAEDTHRHIQIHTAHTCGECVVQARASALFISILTRVWNHRLGISDSVRALSYYLPECNFLSIRRKKESITDSLLCGIRPISYLLLDRAWNY